MRAIRIIIAALLTLGLTLSPVAAGWAQAQMVMCDHEKTMTDGAAMADTQSTVAAQDDCSCCKGVAKCSPSFCAAKCAGSYGLVGADISLVRIPRQIFGADLTAVLRWLTLSPDPPPPRYLMDT